MKSMQESRLKCISLSVLSWVTGGGEEEEVFTRRKYIAFCWNRSKRAAPFSRAPRSETMAPREAATLIILVVLIPVCRHGDRNRAPNMQEEKVYIVFLSQFFTQSSAAVWKSRWPSRTFRPNEPYGLCGRKATLNRASTLVTVCP